MITGNTGEKLTPKQKANQILADAISATLSYWPEDGSTTNSMTPTETEVVANQMKKQADRLAKMLGYEESWYS